MVAADKALVQSRFRKSLSTYRQNAAVQELMARRLAEAVAGLGRQSYGTALEIGCGSGLLTRELAKRLSIGRYILNDLLPECSTLSNEIPNGEFIAGDAEKIFPFPQNLDLAASSAAFQWLGDLPAFLKTLAGALKPDGVLAFSTFGPENLFQIRELAGVSLDYLPLGDIERLLREDFEVRELGEEEITLAFPDALAALSHLKATGVTGVAQRRWTKSSLAAFCEKYHDRFPSGTGVALTYHPITVLAARK